MPPGPGLIQKDYIREVCIYIYIETKLAKMCGNNGKKDYFCTSIFPSLDKHRHCETGTQEH